MFAHSVYTRKGADAFEGRLDMHGIAPMQIFRVTHRIGPTAGILETKYIFDDKHQLDIEFIAFSIREEAAQRQKTSVGVKRRRS